jgi:hypothetical protein
MLVQHMLNRDQLKLLNRQSYVILSSLWRHIARLDDSVVDHRSNNTSDSVIVLIEWAITLIIDDHVAQNNASTYD